MNARRRDFAASVYGRLLARARASGEEFDLLLVRFANERLLHRLGASEVAGRFVLKGATRLLVEGGVPHRPTRDLDLLGFGAPSLDDLARILRELCAPVVEEEGVRFDESSVHAEPIRQGNAHVGVRILLDARLASARIRVQVDVGFGDVVEPEPEWRDLGTLLGHPAPRVRVYPLEAVVAEKLQILVELGFLNTRLKDYFDLHHLARTQSFDGARLARSVRATFERRGTLIPRGVPEGLSDDFARSEGRERQWRALVARAQRETVEELEVVVERLREFLLPLLADSGEQNAWDARRAPGGPWRGVAGTAG